MSAGTNIDLLEEAPPAAGESWRQLAQGSSLHERRFIFGRVSSSKAVLTHSNLVFFSYFSHSSTREPKPVLGAHLEFRF